MCRELPHLVHKQKAQSKAHLKAHCYSTLHTLQQKQHTSASRTQERGGR